MSRKELTIFTHHKCASTWIRAYLDEFCRINMLTLSATNLSNALPKNMAEVRLFTNASYDFVSTHFSEAIHIIRNPLDLIVSSYYSHKVTHPLNDWQDLALQRQVLCSMNEQDGMFATLSFLERDDLHAGAVGPLHALRHWNFDDDRYCTVTMENLVSNPSGILHPIINSHATKFLLPSSDNFMFKSFTGRDVGQIDESSHYRSGKVDQWREALPKPIILYVRAHYNNLLKRFYPSSFED